MGCVKTFFPIQLQVKQTNKQNILLSYACGLEVAGSGACNGSRF